jgi:hypothetical protein
MKRLILTLIVIALIVVAIGLYQGWFVVTSPGNNQDSKTNLNLEIDSGKMREDAEGLSKKAKGPTQDVTGSKKDTEGD